MKRRGTGLSLLSICLVACQPPEAGQRGTQLSASGSGAFEVAMTPFRGGAAVAWYDTRDGNAEIYLRLLDAGGQPLGDEHRLTNDAEESYEVSIDAVGDALAVAWYGRQADGALRAYLGVWDPVAGWLWRSPVSGDRPSRNPVVRSRGGAIFSAWIEDAAAGGGEAVRFGFWTADGARTSETRTLGRAGAETWNLNAALGERGDTAFIVYDAPDVRGVYELFLARVGVNWTSVAQISASDGFASKYPDIALAPAAEERLAALTWFDEKDGNREIYLVVSPVAALTSLQTNEVGRRLSYSDGPSIGSYLAWNDETIGVAWSDRLAQSYDVFLQTFDRAAAPLGEAVAVTTADTDSYVPAIVAWQNGFAVAWNEVLTGPGGDHDTAGSEVYFDLVEPDDQP